MSLPTTFAGRSRNTYYLAYDSFTRANSDNLGNTEAVGPLGGAVIRAWQVIGGDFDISGNNVVAGDVQANLIQNPGFETGGTGGNFNGGAEIDDGISDNFDDWTEGGVNDGAGDKVEATATVQAGAVACKLTRTTATVSVRQSLASTAGKVYRSTSWSRGSGGGENLLHQILAEDFSGIYSGTISKTGAYVQNSVIIAAKDAFLRPYYLCNAAGTGYVDTTSILECHADYIDIGVGDCQIIWNVTTPAAGTDPFGLILRRSGATMWLVQITPGTAGTDLELIELNNGAPTVKDTADIDWVAATSYELTVVCDGQDITVDVDGVEELAENAAAVGETNTQFGMWDGANSNATFEDVAITAA